MKLLKYLICITLISLFFADASISNVEIGKYKTSKKATKVDQRRVNGTGTRSKCISSISKDKLELLVPDEKIAHRTLSKSPSLYIYYHETEEIGIKFTLVNPKSAETLDRQAIHLKHKGVTKINLQPEVELKENQIYLWNIAIPCKNNPSLNQEVLRAGIEKTPNNPITDRNIKNAKSKADEITIYAENGIWYEALQKSLDLTDESTWYEHLQAFDNLLN